MSQSKSSTAPCVSPVTHLDSGPGQVHIALPFRLHAPVLGGLGVAALVGPGHGLSRGQRDDAWYETNDGAHCALTPGSNAGQQVGSKRHVYHNGINGQSEDILAGSYNWKGSDWFSGPSLKWVEALVKIDRCNN